MSTNYLYVFLLLLLFFLFIFAVIKVIEAKEELDNDLIIASWIDEGELDVEQYMTEELIGRLVKEYMVKTNGMPLKIVFPEYDKKGLNEDQSR